MLLLSLITLFAGPLLFRMYARARPVASTLEHAIVAVLIVLVVALLLPEVFAALGIAAPLLVLAGYFLPSLLEHLIRRAAETLHLLTLFAALAGLLVHALMDGAGLAGSHLGAVSGLGLAIALHRFGMGLMLWMIIQPLFGERVAWLTLAAMAVATVLGYLFSERLLPLAGDSFTLALQSVIVGTIVHSLVHRGHVHRHPPKGREQGSESP